MILLVLALLAFAFPAHADMYPDGSNAKIPVATGPAAHTVCLDGAGKMVSTAGGCGSVAAPAAGTDAGPAINACLTAAGSGGTCYVGGSRLTVLSNVSIPAGTTLSCGDSFFDTSVSNIPLFGTAPALLLNSGHTISAAGESAAVKNCLIERNGMTFPAVDSSAFAGTALADAGYSGFIVLDSVILGFDTAVYITGARPYLRHVYADGTGVTHAVIEHAVSGQYDIGYIHDIKIQPFATGNYAPGSVSCAAAQRAGTGMRLGGIDYLGDIIVQNFQVAQYDIQNQELGGNLWADNIALYCGYGTTIGVYLDGNGYLFNTALNLNANNIGLYVGTSTNLVSYLSSVFLDYIGQDGIAVAAGGAGGSLDIGLLNTNPYNKNASFTGAISGTTLTVTGLTGTLTGGDFIRGAGVAQGTRILGTALCTSTCAVSISQTVASTAMTNAGAVGRFVVSMQDLTGASRVTIHKAVLNAVQGGVKPYFFTNATGSAALLGHQLSIDHLLTDLPDQNPFTGSGFSAGPGAEAMLSDIAVGSGGTCTGVGTGTCTIDAGSTITRGTILLSPAGTPSGSGTVYLFMPVPAPTEYLCTATLGAGSNTWPNPPVPSVQIAGGAATVNIGWAAPLAAGSTYRIYYNCKP